MLIAGTSRVGSHWGLSGRFQLTPGRKSNFKGGLLGAAFLSLMGCAHVVPLTLEEDRVGQVTVPQTQEGQHLVVDLTSIHAGSRLTLSPARAGDWPKSIVLRVSPNSATSLDIQGRLRMIVPVKAEASTPAEVVVLREVYVGETSPIVIRFLKRADAENGQARP